MIKIIGLIYYLSPIIALGSFVAFLVARRYEKREAAATELREQRRKEHEADCFRAGADIRFERFKRKFVEWKSSNIESALYAGAKRIDEMRAK